MVLPDQSGLFFHERSPDALAEAVPAFRPDHFDPVAIRRHALTFGPDRFKAEITAAVAAALAAGKYTPAARRASTSPQHHESNRATK